MELNLPILDRLSACKSILIAGMGGGFDVFCGLPIYLDLKRRGLNVHLASYSFSYLVGLTDQYSLNEGLIGVTADLDTYRTYFPELHLAKWFREKLKEEVIVWCFEKTGVRPLIDNYHALTEHLETDGILLIDGGVDSLLRGDETEIGTLLEDTISLCAVAELRSIPNKFVACIGFGAEQQVTHAHVLENIADLSKVDAFLGVCALLRQIPVYQLYEDAVHFTQGHPEQDPSVINSSIVSAVRGQYGNYHLTAKTRGSRLWISPLMPIYWFFDMQTLAKRNRLLPEIRWTDTFTDAVREAWKAMARIPKRKHSEIPLT